MPVRKRTNRKGREGSNLKHRKALGAAALLLAAALAFAFFSQRRQSDEALRLTYTEFWAMARNGEIDRVTIDGSGEWQAALADGRRAVTPDPRAADGKERLLALDIEVKEAQSAGGVPLLGVAAALFLLLFFARGGRGAAGLKSYAAVTGESAVPPVTFQDVAAAEDTLQSLKDLVDFLRSPEEFRRRGARFPKGVLLYGPPGNGKTLLARALAGEAKAPFFAMNGADFVQVYVGVGASRVRELFRKARKAGRAVIFIDEIDAIGKKRDSANDEREQTLNALLTEMSGFREGEGIIVLAATNRPDTLDAALTREGRFDRRIEVGLPDVRSRLKILRVHAKNKPIDGRVSLEELARRTVMFSGAQLETLLNEAAIRAARSKKDSIGQAEIDEAFCAVTVGEERPGTLSPQERRITAWHEAGHAVATRYLLPGARLEKLTVIPSSRGAAGYMMSVGEEKLLHTRTELMGMLCAALGGRCAEEMLLGKCDVTTGAAGDLRRAREIAAAMAADYAMGPTGDAEKDRRLILEEAFEKARACLSAHEADLRALAEALLDHETLYAEEIAKLLAA